MRLFVYLCTDISCLDWLPTTRESVLSQENPDPLVIYQAQKVLSEQAAWKFAEEHPHIEMATGTFHSLDFCRSVELTNTQ